MNELRLNMPSSQDTDFGDPWQLEMYMESRDRGLLQLVADMREQMNNPRFVVLPSGKTLNEKEEEAPLWPGCVWAVDSTMAVARREAAKRNARVCDGSGGTPDLRHRFLYGANEGEERTEGGALTHSHTDNLAVASHDHNHSLTIPVHAHNLGAASSMTPTLDHDHGGSTGQPDTIVERHECDQAYNVAGCDHAHSISICGGHCHTLSGASEDYAECDVTGTVDACTATLTGEVGSSAWLPPWYGVVWVRKMHE